MTIIEVIERSDRKKHPTMIKCEVLSYDDIISKINYGWKYNGHLNVLDSNGKLVTVKVLTRFQWLAKPFFTWPGFGVWLIVVGAAVFLAGFHWDELTENVTDRILNPGNLVVLWLVFPVLKAFHEFGHGFAVKVKGGEVHDMGIMLLVLTPVPYVDASAASAFREKRDRILVGAAGMAVEIFIGALALFFWATAEPGALRSLAYNVIFIAGVSSLLFNGNALLRYDAYYILSDLLEIPYLGPRGLRYVGYLFEITRNHCSTGQYFGRGNLH